MIKPKSANFRLEEFYSKDKSGAVRPPIKYWRNIQNIMRDLEIIRQHCGNAPIYINSAYRTEAHNKAVKGEKNSYHLTGSAVDIRCPSISVDSFHRIILTLMNNGKIKKGGLGKYNSFVHYDQRGYLAQWNGK